MTRIKKIGMVLLLLHLGGCAVFSPVTPGDYVRWVEDADHGLHVTKTIDGLVFDLQYIPLEMAVMRYLSGEKADERIIRETKKKLAGHDYFTLKISESTLKNEILRKDLRSMQDYYSRVEYYSHMMQEDLALATSEDTVSCVLFHWERTFNADPALTFSLAFTTPRGAGQGTTRTLIYHERIFGTGNVLLSILGTDMAQIPEFELKRIQEIKR